MRTAAREAAFKLVFASRFNGEIDDGLKNALIKTDKLDKDDCLYLDRVLGILKEHEEEFIRETDEISSAFPESRLFPADKSIILVALSEIKYMDDIPQAVSLNEAANIASKYSTAKSASFVSGILSEFIKE